MSATSEPRLASGSKPGSETDLERLKARLFTAVLSDVMDSLGHTRQAMTPRVRPLDDELVMVGRARTGYYMEVFEAPEGENPYDLEIGLVDDLQAGEVVVLGCSGSNRIAPWGDLLSTAARSRGAAGCVTDGLVRDIRSIRKAKFPVFHGGIGPLDTKGRGRIMATDVKIECAGAPVQPGDIVFGDADGVVVIPRSIEDEVIERAFEKVLGEDRSKEELLSGQSLRAVFDKYGVL